MNESFNGHSEILYKDIEDEEHNNETYKHSKIITNDLTLIVLMIWENISYLLFITLIV